MLTRRSHDKNTPVRVGDDECFHGNKYKYKCVRCGRKTCGDFDCARYFHFFSDEFDVEGFSLYCPNCGDYLCHNCLTTKESFWGRKYYCGKCNTGLKKKPRLGHK